MFSVCALVYTVNGMILILKVVNNGNRRRIKNKIKKIIKTITIPFILSTSHRIALGKTIKNVLLI